MCHKLLLIVVVVGCLASGVVGYSKGAPKEVCEDMTPQHHTPPQPSNTTPYLIKMNRNKIQSGETVNFTISSNNGAPIKGFMLQVRVGQTPVGRFSASSEVQTVDCGTGKQNAATHTSANEKKNIRVTWTAPEGLKENVNMYATLAKDGGTFWVAQKSRSITVS